MFRLDELLKEIIEDAYVSQSSRKIALKSSFEITVHADRDKIGNVISNLLSNADKYSPNGSVIQVACESIDDYVKVSIKDDGMGIEPKDLDKLFERYYRVQGNHTISGFGIGLYLSAEII